MNVLDRHSSLRELPRDTLVPLGWILDRLDEDESAEEQSIPDSVSDTPETDSWRLKLWTAPAECRIGPAEVCEAVGRTRPWLYRRTGAKAKDRIPHRKFGGELVFVVGELREWIRDTEELVEVGQTDGRFLKVSRGGA